MTKSLQVPPFQQGLESHSFGFAVKHITHRNALDVVKTELQRAWLAIEGQERRDVWLRDDEVMVMLVVTQVNTDVAGDHSGLMTCNGCEVSPKGK